MAIPNQAFLVWASDNTSANLNFDSSDYVVWSGDNFLIGFNSGVASAYFSYTSGTSAKFYPQLQSLKPNISLFSLDASNRLKISTNNQFDLLVRFFFKFQSGVDTLFYIGDLNSGNTTAWLVFKQTGELEIWREGGASPVSTYSNFPDLTKWYELELKYRYPNLPNSTNSLGVDIYSFSWTGNQASNRTLLTSLNGGTPNRKGEYVWFQLNSPGNSSIKLDWFRIFQGWGIFEIV